ncbi:hypothetical protein BX600DRAFT_60300 [Xylariales sp. PMI_506]|nr:hypothetical protein BX600DRAFT_60300 [Xylariales sp. PMI_506]
MKHQPRQRTTATLAIDTTTPQPRTSTLGATVVSGCSTASASEIRSEASTTKSHDVDFDHIGKVLQSYIQNQETPNTTLFERGRPRERYDYIAPKQRASVKTLANPGDQESNEDKIDTSLNSVTRTVHTRNTEDGVHGRPPEPMNISFSSS